LLNQTPMEKNNLDHLFREKFKDFSEIPDEGVWENIEASLNKRKKKRMVPIWWPLGGAAAAIAILFYLINPFSNTENTALPRISDTEEKIPSAIENEVEDTKNFQKSQEIQIVDAENENQKNILDSENQEVDRRNSLKSNSATSSSNLSDLGEIAVTHTKNREEQLQTSESLFEKDNGDKVITSVTIENEPQNPINVPSLNPNEVLQENNEVADVEKDDDQGKISIFDAIEEQQDQNEETVSDKLENRWAMGPSIAPVFFSTLGEGSPIHSDFVPNSKSGNLNLSYGLVASYKVSKKLSIRSGVHRVNHSYDTNDVAFSSSSSTTSETQIDNIDYNETSRNVIVESQAKDQEAVTDNSSVDFTSSSSSSLDGEMVQQLGYIEVPMELNYAIVDKKFGINLIGGISSLFLVDNAVSLESDDLVTEMGEANNANSVNFSTNIGIGVSYKIAPKVQLNVEPMFKYQLNTFSDTEGNFMPYSIGVYSGLNYRF